MKEEAVTTGEKPDSGAAALTVPFSSNDIRLSPREWLIALGLFAVLFVSVPRGWERIEPFSPDSDYRLVYQLSEDYWMYSRYCRQASSGNAVAVIGDSVIWGHYVMRDQTLSHYLNEYSGERHFANLGVDGIHPAALAGLLRYYGGAIAEQSVVLHFNPLWLSSAQHDLQGPKEFAFNHPELVAQFMPKIPCYRQTVTNRLGIVVGRYWPFRRWVRHIQAAYYEGLDLPSWTLEHPYQNPLKQITFKLPDGYGNVYYDPTTWYEKGIPVQKLQWVEMETSLQWYFFRQALEILKKRGNEVFVIVGPFNEHLLDEESFDVYQEMKRKIETWLQQNEIPYLLPAVLPSDYYADACHSLEGGYAVLARQLMADESFKSLVLSRIHSPGKRP